MVESTKLRKLEEGFRGFQYISNGQLLDTGQEVRIKIEAIPVNKIAVFMAMLVVAFLVGNWIYGVEGKMIFGLSIAALASAGMFVGLFWLVNQSSSNAKNPWIDEQKDELVLPSGNKLGKKEIARFIQFECKTIASNFRLVVTTVEHVNGKEFAVCAETGRKKNEKIGRQIAAYFDLPVEFRSEVIKSREQLELLGLH